MILIALGGLVYLLGAIGLLFSAFREHVVWGLFCLFTQIGNFIFAIVHFDKCKGSLGIMLLGILLMALGMIVIVI